MFLQFFIWGSWYVTAPNYLGTIGFTATDFGDTYSVGPIAGMIAPFFVGMVADRFFVSTYAYQIAGHGLNADLIRQANALATQGIVPDLTLLLTLPANDATVRRSARGQADRLERYGADFDARVAAAYAASVTEAWQVRHPECGPIVAVAAKGSVDKVTARLVHTIVEHTSATAVLTA